MSHSSTTGLPLLHNPQMSMSLNSQEAWKDKLTVKFGKNKVLEHENIHREVCSHVKPSHVCQELATTIISHKMTIILAPNDHEKGYKEVENGHLKISLENFSKILKIMRTTIYFLKYDTKTKVHGKGLWSLTTKLTIERCFEIEPKRIWKQGFATDLKKKQKKTKTGSKDHFLKKIHFDKISNMWLSFLLFKN